MNIFLVEQLDKREYPSKRLPQFQHSFWETYSLTLDSFKTLTPTQKDNVINDLSELINTLSTRLRLLTSII